MDTKKLKSEALILKKLLTEYKDKESDAKLCLEVLTPLLDRAIQEEVKGPENKVPCGYYFHEGALRNYSDLENSYSNFACSLRGWKEEDMEEFLKEEEGKEDKTEYEEFDESKD